MVIKRLLESNNLSAENLGTWLSDIFLLIILFVFWNKGNGDSPRVENIAEWNTESEKSIENTEVSDG